MLGCSGRTDLRLPSPDAGVPVGPAPDAGPPPIEETDKVDLLLVVDNSKNLSAAQEVLATTLSYLMDRLAHPACVNGLGQVVATPGDDQPCPVGERDFPPVADLHVGVISTSLGGHGADTCSKASPAFDPLQNDAAHLLTRTVNGEVVPSYQHHGFLAWDPGQSKSPPGDTDLDTLTLKLEEMVRGAGTKGCGFESQLESIYRFLVDPEPYLQIDVVDGQAVPSGLDEVLLDQRAAFLRPDSALMIVLLTDEDDCSTREEGQYYLSNQGTTTGGAHYHLPRGRAVCATDPDDRCCTSCAAQTPDGCLPAESDPACLAPALTDADDPINLRCWDQKRRFGIDFLYPVERYVRALSEPTVIGRDGAEQRNPIFSGNRSPKMVFLAGIVGVPWQDIANDPKSLSSGYLSASQVDWQLVLGDGAGADPLMQTSVTPRTGVHPITGEDLAPPSASSPDANEINGHERDIPTADDLQYACIYPLRAPRECVADFECECFGGGVTTNPICQSEDGSYAEVQRYARALPSRRPLAVLRGLGDQGVVASVCARNVDDSSVADYAYRPAVDAALRALRPRLER